MADQQQTVLLITDKIFVDYTIPGGVQVCTHEFMDYFTAAGYTVKVVKVTPNVTFLRKVKKKLHIEAYEMYDIDNWLEEIVSTINSDNISLVLFNQVNLAHWSEPIKKKVSANVKFVGLSHGNESGDYLHEITHSSIPSFLKTWKLGKLLVKEKVIFSKYLDAVITISDNETYIDQWLGAQNVFYLPRLLKPDFIEWKPQAKTVGFVGTLNHLPNIEGIQLLADQLQLHGFDGTMKIAGSPPELGHALEKEYAFIRYCGVPDEIQLKAEAATWAIFLNPVFWYARGSSTKLSKAINWGMPALSTVAGARGYDLSDKSLVTKDNLPASMAEKIIDTLGSEASLNNLKQAAENNASHFDLDKWTTDLSAFLNSIQ